MKRHLILLACTAGLIAACAAPTPEPTPTVTPTITLTLTPSPVPPTDTPTPPPRPAATPVPRRVIVRSRGQVICGIDATRPELAGFDTDMCRAIAAALFDNPDATGVSPIDPATAAAALTSHDIDVYLGAGDAASLDTGVTLFLDAAGAMARTDVGIRGMADLKFATVCLMQDTVEEALFNVAAELTRVTYQPYLFNRDDADAMYAIYNQGHCDAVVDNRVRLWQRQPTLTVPRDHGLIDLSLLIGARGPFTAGDDLNWTSIVDAISRSLIHAEALGVDSGNLEAALTSDNTDVRQLLGLEDAGGWRLGLSRSFAARVIRQVGNYGEIYERNFGDLPRGPNGLAQDGGLIGQP